MYELINQYCYELTFDVTNDEEVIDDIEQFFLDNKVYRYFISFSNSPNPKSMRVFIPKEYENLAVWLVMFPAFKSKKRL